MAGFYSYIPLLCKYLRIVQPKRILEWGPGESTKVMAKICPEADIYTVEHNKEYYNEFHSLTENSKIHLYHHQLGDGYTYFPCRVGGKFDLVFIDGLDTTRPKCLLTSFDFLNEGAIVILHDSERLEYREAINRFKILEEINGTVVLTK